MKYYFNVLKRYKIYFAGRARRKEYWFFFLIDFLISSTVGIVAIVMLAGAVFSIVTESALYDFAPEAYLSIIMGMLIPWALLMILAIYKTIVFIPAIDVMVRRLHDTNRSGWWYFIQAVPFIGGIWLLVLLCTDGDRGSNSFGDDPKEQTIPQYGNTPEYQGGNVSAQQTYQTQQNNPQEVFCKKCHNKLTSNSSFCESCGWAI